MGAKFGPLRHYLGAMRMAWTAGCFGFALAAGAQSGEHPFLESYDLTVQEGRVLVQWVMQGGATCDGSAVERSTDGERFETVHRLEGLCGDPAVPVPYSWADADPPELSTLHYRIAFAAEGRSSVKRVRFDQLNRSTHRLYPSPTAGPCSLLLRVPESARVDLRIFDAQGRPVMERRGAAGRWHAIDLTGHAAGLYTVVAVAEGQRFDARVVKE